MLYLQLHLKWFFCLNLLSEVQVTASLTLYTVLYKYFNSDFL